MEVLQKTTSKFGEVKKAEKLRETKSVPSYVGRKISMVVDNDGI